MTTKLHERRIQRWEDRGFKNLLVWLLLYLVAGPFLESLPLAEMFISALLTLALISAVAVMSESKGMVAVAGGFLVLTLGLVWVRTLGTSFPQVDYAALALACFLTILVISFGKHLARVRRVSTNVVCAALCLYLVIGLLWGALFALLESVVPGSFAGPLLDQSSSPSDDARHLQYLSFVTLSTLGYGDITPQTRGAASLCQVEAILGQFLTVVLVARLVGVQVAQETNRIPD